MNQFPGLNQPVETLGEACFPHAIAKSWCFKGVTYRELRMLDFITKTTDKPGWETKVFDAQTVSQWRSEVDAHPVVGRNDVYMSKDMFDFCIKELRDKSRRFQETGRVNVLDTEMVIVKSDKAISKNLQQELKEGVRILENVPESLKDWEPDSNDTVLNLVNPSLYPVIWGLTKALPQGTVPLKNCTRFTCEGVATQQADTRNPTDVPDTLEECEENYDAPAIWGSYQWLSAEVSIKPDGTAEILSYVNNLDPEKHKSLYDVLERVVAATIPLWEDTLNGFADRRRIDLKDAGWEEWTFPEGAIYDIPNRWCGYKALYDPITETYSDRGYTKNLPDWLVPEPVYDPDEEYESDGELKESYYPDDHYDTDDWMKEEDWKEWESLHRSPVYQEPRKYIPQADFLKPEHLLQYVKDLDAPFSLRNNLPHGRNLTQPAPLQIIFKMVNIHLTPENRSYDGDYWQVEGTLNEMICASAVYYYDDDNIEESYLGFSSVIDVAHNRMVSCQHGGEAAENVFEYMKAHLSDDPLRSKFQARQDLGHVLTREGRLVAYPNCLRHGVGRFSLQDETKPGHRKILAMFLVDPHRPILSSAHVPPQKKEGWVAELQRKCPLNRLPQEVFDMVMEEHSGYPLSRDEALKHAKKLKKERDEFVRDVAHYVNTQFYEFGE